MTTPSVYNGLSFTEKTTPTQVNREGSLGWQR